VRLATAAGVSAGTCDLDQVQVHPTGFVDPANPDAKTKFLAAEALRGAGGLLLDARGGRFVREVERRDVVTAAMQAAEEQGPVRLVLGERAAAEVKSHCALCLHRACFIGVTDSCPRRRLLRVEGVDEALCRCGGVRCGRGDPAREHPHDVHGLRRGGGSFWRCQWSVCLSFFLSNIVAFIAH
jgi:hypothetical protein